MKTLKKIAFASGLALWAWLGFSFPASAQAEKGMSCDTNEATPCDIFTPYLVCNNRGAWGGHECTVWYDAGHLPGVEAAPNSDECGQPNSPWPVLSCASDHCLPGMLNRSTRFADAGTCCAAPGQALADYPVGIGTECLNTNQTFAGPFGQYPSDPKAGTIGCGYPGYYLSGVWHPSDIYFFDGGLVCANYSDSSYDYAQTFVDAGSDLVLGGLYHLMRSDATLWDAGIVILEPLGFLPSEYASGNDSQPNYVCGMQAYNNYTGTWLLEHVGATDVDLTECGGKPSDGPNRYFPCCGEQHDAGSGQPGLCTPDARGATHCACIQDGNPCDRPRRLDTQFFDPDECCSPGLGVQMWDPAAPIYDGGANPVLYAGEGWCRSAAGVDPHNGGSVSVQAPGYCNALPDGQACSWNTDCYTNRLEPAGHNSCNGATHTCMLCPGLHGPCATTADCCQSQLCFSDGGTGHNYCGT